MKFKTLFSTFIVASLLLAPATPLRAGSFTNSDDNANLMAYDVVPNYTWTTNNGGIGYGLWTVLGGLTGGGPFMEGVNANKRQVDGTNSFGLYANSVASLSGFAVSRPLSNSVMVGVFEITTRYDMAGIRDNLVSLRAGNNTGSFNSGELLAFGLGGTTNSHMVLGYRDSTGLHLLPSGEARDALSATPADLAAATGALWHWKIYFDTASGNYQLSVTNPAAAGKYSAVVTGTLEPGGTNVGSFAVINSSTGDYQNYVFDSPAFSTVRPLLNIELAGTNAILSWPTNAPGFYYSGFTLQSTTNLGAPVFWNTNLPSPSNINGQNTVTNDISDAQRFYRLVR